MVFVCSLHMTETLIRDIERHFAPEMIRLQQGHITGGSLCTLPSPVSPLCDRRAFVVVAYGSASLGNS